MRKLLLGTAVVMAAGAIATALALVATCAVLVGLSPNLQGAVRYED